MMNRDLEIRRELRKLVAELVVIFVAIVAVTFPGFMTVAGSQRGQSASANCPLFPCSPFWGNGGRKCKQCISPAPKTKQVLFGRGSGGKV